MKKTGNGFRLSTGKEFYANRHILGLGYFQKSLVIFEGYDGGVDAKNFSQEEKKEIAEYMIDLWKQFSKTR